MLVIDNISFIHYTIIILDGENITVSNADGNYDFSPSDMKFLKDGVSIDYESILIQYAKVNYKLNCLPTEIKGGLLAQSLR